MLFSATRKMIDWLLSFLVGNLLKYVSLMNLYLLLYRNHTAVHNYIRSMLQENKSYHFLNLHKINKSLSYFQYNWKWWRELRPPDWRTQSLHEEDGIQHLNTAMRLDGTAGLCTKLRLHWLILFEWFILK